MSNPVLNPNDFKCDVEGAETRVIYENQLMTVNGTIQLVGFMGLIMIAAAVYVWMRFSLGYTDLAMTLTWAGAIVGFVLAIIISFTRFSAALKNIKYLVPMYAACEGLFLGGISATFETAYPGIVSKAIAGTFAALFSMLILYRMRTISCTDKFRSVIFISTLSVAGVYLIDLIGHLFGHSIPILYSASPLGIAVSIVIVIIAALNLIIDFDYIERAVANHFPKDYEWYGAFGLLVTIVWLYVEILRLLAKFQRR